MSRLLRAFSYAAPLLSLVAPSGAEEFIKIEVPNPLLSLPNGGAQLLQMDDQINITESIEVISIPTTLFSARCGELIFSLNQEGANSPLGDIATQLMGQYIALVVNTFQQCVLPGLLTPSDIDNGGELVRINASPCNEVSNQLNTFENTCEGAISAAPPSVCDMTFQQNFFQNDVEAYIGYDLYYCIPNVCSAEDVERLGARVMSELQAMVESDITGTSTFGVWTTCSDSAGLIRDFNAVDGADSSFITTLTVSGTGDIAPNTEAGSVIVSVESPISPTPLVDGVVCKITEDLAGEDWAKNCCGQLNLNEDFRNLRMYCDVNERSSSNNMIIYSPFDNVEFLCQADANAQDNQPGNQPVQPCTSFNGVNTVGISLIGETTPFNPDPMPTNPDTPTITQPDLIPTLPNRQTLPPQIITGNGPAPPLIDILNGPAANAAAGSARPLLFASSLVSAALAFFSSRV